MNIFTLNDYRKVISSKMEKKKFIDRRYTFQNMAEHIRIQKPYISKVMNGRADFSTDQLYMACDFLELNTEEREYMLLLLERERSTYQERIAELDKKIEAIQDTKRDSAEVLPKKVKQMTVTEFDNSTYIQYYLDPIIQIVHIFLTIKRFRENRSAICKELNISEDHLSEILAKLANMKLIEIQKDKIEILNNHMHLPRESNIMPPHQQLISQLASHRKNRLPINKKKCFNVTFAADEETRKQIENEFNLLLDKVSKMVGKSKNKDCYQLSFDLFPWSSSK